MKRLLTAAKMYGVGRAWRFYRGGFLPSERELRASARRAAYRATQDGDVTPVRKGDPYVAVALVILLYALKREYDARKADL